MKSIKGFAFVCLLWPLIFSCEWNQAPAFSVIGFWKENISRVSIGILNRPDGTSRLYLLDRTDTASALHKYDGTYSVQGNKYRFQSKSNREGIDIYLETTHNSSGTMSGMLVTQSFSQLAAFTSF